ncbi:flagellar hook protein FlgE [Pantoea eucalypti]|jgi:flagellar hook protein FlgE|uniref:Flagellar hook protein FlgE n=1 Tax=Pantoea eucalypti TaxID=470933 RepID=A0ABY2ZKX9_9GAMM|nr:MULTISPECIES: flagellar hook protein FlgE [Pantoea]PQL28453.1 flagellar hook protein FlgE [Pantoea ananatis]AWP33312.1 flagellar hook protein FlgE [Pantoea vagans]EFM19721.1 fagellar hook-basal body protein [Pantoea sp. aB]ELP26025.1 Flagellar hook protein FlgE [Pantoea agglomerans 299R]MBD9550830.1 flagellar hook protein FlgE [Pantoea sp. PNT01]
MSFSQAVSGLGAASSNLDVIGNNIANSATAGFKSSTIAFADMFAGSNVGLGTKVAAVIQNFNDGATTTTSRGLDVALSGNGFFRMTDSSGGVFYSRNGQLTLDANRNLVNTQGLNVTGYPASGSPATIQAGANPVALRIPTEQMPARATTTAGLVANLNSTDTTPSVPTFSTANADSYNKKTTATVFDSQGNDHALDMYFAKDTASNSWTVRTIDANTGLSAGDFRMAFDTSGKLTSVSKLNANGTVASTTTDGTVGLTLNVGGANGAVANQPITMSMLGSLQQNTGATNFGSPTQDGYAPGDLTSYAINNDGTITGSYSNQKTQLLGQIVLSSFSNPEGLQSKGDNVWQASSASGQAAIGLANTGTFGSLTAGALESSNVDMSKELVNMIVAQRNYQANAQTIKTQDQILNTLVNLR